MKIEGRWESRNPSSPEADRSAFGAAPTADESVQHNHPIPRRYLELAQDAIVFCLCAMLLVTMGLKLVDLARLLIRGTDFSLIVGDTYNDKRKEIKIWKG
jgi:hypothetical protein